MNRVFPIFTAVSLTCLPAFAGSPILSASDGAAFDYFGASVALSETTSIIGAEGDTIDSKSNQGSAYVFRNLEIATGIVNQHAKLTASDGAAYDGLGRSVALSGNIAIIGAGNKNFDEGAAYIFRNLQAASGTVVEDLKLSASDGQRGDSFGKSVCISGTTAIVAAAYATVGVNGHQGTAYVFQNLGSASGTMNQNAKLIASDGTFADYFGQSVAISGNTVISGAALDDIEALENQGSAYVFRNVNNVNGTVTQDVKLIASDGGRDSFFGTAVSLSGDTAIVGAYGSSHSSERGAAYVFSDLNAATGTVTESARLAAPTPTGRSNGFGAAVAISGTVAIVGAPSDQISTNSQQGSAYLFGKLDTARGSITHNVKLIASDGATNDSFGSAVALDGDRFAIGTPYKNNYAGRAYTGVISALTTLDVADTSHTVDGISFVSQDDWVIGKTTGNNVVALSYGDSAVVTAPGKFVAIGQDAGADGNTLRIDGTVTANQILIGASGNKDNTLRLNSSGAIIGATLRLARGNFLSVQGDFSSPGALLARLATSTLQVWDGDSWEVLTNANQNELLRFKFSGSETNFTPNFPLSNAGWRKIFFGSDAEDPFVSGWTADPDNDGLSNLLERAFNLPPLLAGVVTLQAGTGTSGVPLVSLVHAEVPLLTIEFIRLKASTNSGLIYTPQFSSTLDERHWNSAIGAETVESIDETWERVKVTDTITSAPRRFGRVKVESP